MTKLPLALALAAALGASGSALAAQTQTPATGSTASSDQTKPLGQSNLSQQLHDQLSKEGYTSIKIMPSSFYIQAKDKKGDPVAMVIGPDTFTEVMEMKPQANASNAPAPSPSQPSASPTQK